MDAFGAFFDVPLREGLDPEDRSEEASLNVLAHRGDEHDSRCRVDNTAGEARGGRSFFPLAGPEGAGALLSAPASLGRGGRQIPRRTVLAPTGTGGRSRSASCPQLLHRFGS